MDNSIKFTLNWLENSRQLRLRLSAKQKCFYCFIQILRILIGEVSGGGSSNWVGLHECNMQQRCTDPEILSPRQSAILTNDPRSQHESRAKKN